MSDERELYYGEERNTEVDHAVINQNVEALDLSTTRIVVDIANIDQYPNEEYALLRRNGFGASDSSILLGVNPYKTLDELIKEKASTVLSDEERAIGEKVAVKKGRDLEPLIIQKFQKYFKQDCIKPPHMYRDKEYEFLKTNFDGVTGTPEQYVPAEIKVVTAAGEKHYITPKAMFNEYEGFKPLPIDVSQNNLSIISKAAHYGIPPYYYTQVQQQIMALNAPFGYLSVLLDKSWSFYTFFIYRDEAVINQIIVNGYKAWERVEALKASRG